MALCTDKSLTILSKLGYNVVRLPKAGISPLHLFGMRNKSSRPLGRIPIAPGTPLPAITEDTQVSAINGKASSKLNLDLGLNILGNFIGAMGGNLGVNLTWTDAQKVEFKYQNVKEDSVEAVQVSSLFDGPGVQLGTSLISDYLLGPGKIYIITATLKSNSITVSFERSGGKGAEVKIPVIQEMVGGSIKVTTESTKSHVVTFEGTSDLVFGFQCLEIVIDNGKYKLRPSKEGATFMGASGGKKRPSVILSEEGGLLDW